jgi:23S rRNA (guanosine2251-2'-O)-methyltransferase
MTLLLIKNNQNMKKWIVCENLRSAYNVGNIMRTADGLGWGVILLGYTAPKDHKKVTKTALGAEENIEIMNFTTLEEFYAWIKDNNILLVSAEKTDKSISLIQVLTEKSRLMEAPSLAVLMGNEITGVEEETLTKSDYVTHIDMIGTKESFNVGQAAAILMWEFNKILS